MVGPRAVVRRCGAAVAAVVLLMGLTPGRARAESGPDITSGPAIAGTPRAGAVLTANAAWTGDPTPTATWTGRRCPPPTGRAPRILRLPTRPHPGAPRAA